MIDWKNELKQALARSEAFAARHPRALTASVVSLLGGFAVTAFGIAPLAPNAEDLPQRVITEQVQVLDLEDQLSALAAHDLTLVRNDVTRASDTADSLLRRMGAFDPAAAAFLRNDPLGQRVLKGRVGKMVQLSAEPDGTVHSMVVRFPAELAEQQATHFSRLSIERKGQGFSAKLETAPLQPQVRLGSGTVRSSLFVATDEAGIPDAVASQMADMFSGDIDFHRELRKGDRFSVVFESLTADGEPINWGQASGRVIAAEFVNNGKSHSAVWFKDPSSGKGNFYGFDGQSKRRAFLASPMEFSRVTSGFAMRFHPVLQKWRAHLGIDYGAPTGTPVRSVGDGVVEFAGWQNGFGNVIFVRHSGDRQTVYAHLSRMDVKKGQRIEQGQRIGAVGATGWATGPHLHFEFRVKGQHQDPRVIARASEAITLPASAKTQFQATVASVKNQLSAAESMGVGVSGAD
ncbi:MAG: peptidoglycan DD-metalloendopeptidase family protein [Roseateles asaccharophilus]|uniref:Murein DD-endopeptidase MepM/ murein hydrolase activator NlpD n=1 Tax=Roseateles asaccharophilus TaxID=582607 RepID=A0A4R6N537_9BURK|nr:M23 family metallopeptidase [Roseateles asaccharophilus]MDN3544116.1 peptidoglycan DD-metalloendopeptidase family protein [Roseateles asaccharophilus]TDP09290.1 murein DD-endopeptidase MepM/ murein hydrolase activator NlpD [Roseateles asaccharophilus]